MAPTTTTRSDYVRALPKLTDAAELIGLDASSVTRAIQRLGIEPLRWGGRDKHLAIADVLTIAASAQRASLEEVAGSLLEWAEREHPEHVDVFTAEIDAYFAALPAPKAQQPEAFVAELRAALPKHWATKAEEIARRHAPTCPVTPGAATMLKRIHVNQHVIRANQRLDQLDPPITVKTYRRNHRAHRVVIDGSSELVYAPSRPLPCGARLWIETRAPVVLYDADGVVVAES